MNYLDYFEDDMSICKFLHRVLCTNILIHPLVLVMELVSGGDLMDYINIRLQSGGYMGAS